MKRLKLLYARAIEYLFVRTLNQVPLLPGTDPDDGGHGTLRFAWNDPNGRNRPLFCAIMNHTKTGERARILLSPAQVQLLDMYLREGLQDQARKFKWDEAPDWDTRWIRVPDEEK